ncbi:MAG: putative LPS assembly protein LptD, partial [Bacteroidales bacterium]|nr:putative LPS assembly protein LptD [Bacteroidales bacterium]
MRLSERNRLFPLVVVALMLLLSVGIDAQRPKKGGKGAGADPTRVEAPTAPGARRGVPADTLTSDSIATDSIPNDTVGKRQSPIEAPVKYKANDSIVFTAGGFARLYGESKVNYQNIELTSEQISMNLDSSVVHAVGVTDSTGVLQGTPVFKEGETPYESEVMSYNFKSKKGFIHSITTQQGEGYVTSENAKKDADDIIYMRSGRYTTCDNHEHPHFYLALSMAKVRAKKNVVFGPATLVVEDVHLPIAIPFGFFPFSSSYSSGFIMPTYGDEMNRGFYLRDGGYYFAINDNVDLKVLGEIFTKGSWGVSAASNYNKRYKYSGSFNASYLITKTGEKNIPEDYNVTKDFKISWSHRQDAKANPNSTFSASVNFATSSYDQRNLSSLYNPQQFSQNTKASSVSYSRTFQEIGLNLSSTFNITQNTRDSSISMTLPDLNIALNRLYPFKRKKAAGAERWYEKISLQYTGNVTNSISTKENLLMSTPLTQWKNGFQHTIPVSATFTLFNYLNVVPSVNYVSRWYMNRYEQSYDPSTHTIRKDTINGFNRVWNYNLSLQMNTKLYGFYKPWKMFGEKVQMIRHLITPSVSFSYAPDFGSARYGYYKTLVYTDEKGEARQVEYSPYEGMAYGVPGRGLAENINFSIDNNVEMKIKSDKDTTGIRKISLIDQLSANISYNAAAKTRPWSDLSMSLRLKLTKSYTFNMNASFATYAYQYDEKGNVVVGDRTEWSYGRFGRFQGYSGSFSYSLNNDTFKKLFQGGDDKDKDKKK